MTCLAFTPLSNSLSGQVTIILNTYYICRSYGHFIFVKKLMSSFFFVLEWWGQHHLVRSVLSGSSGILSHCSDTFPLIRLITIMRSREFKANCSDVCHSTYTLPPPFYLSNLHPPHNCKCDYSSPQNQTVRPF